MLKFVYIVESSSYGIEVFDAKFECPSMYTAWDMVLSMQEDEHAHYLTFLNLVKLSYPLYMVYKCFMQSLNVLACIQPDI